MSWIFHKSSNILINFFRWGHSFLELNSELLELYANCKSPKEILEVQQKYLEDSEKERQDRNLDDMWPTSSSESESEEEPKAQTSNDQSWLQFILICLFLELRAN